MGQPCGFWLGLPLCVSAVLERVHGVRFVVLCLPFAWQCAKHKAALVSLCALAPPIFSLGEISSTRLWDTQRSAAQLVRTHRSTTSVT